MPNDTSPESFYTASTDKRGHREQLRATAVTPGLHGAMSVVVGSGLFPYKTFGDLQRDSLQHRVSYLLEQMDDDEFVQAAKKALETDRIIAAAEAKKQAKERQREMMEIVLSQIDSEWATFDGIDFRPLADAYNAVTFRDIADDFDRRLQRLGINPAEFSE